jgi:REP element-mobilizing transposase RayT
VRRKNANRGQRELAFPSGWGGRRAGAGAKPKGERAGVSHRQRAELAPWRPVHVTLELTRGLPSLRGAREHAVLAAALAALRAREDFRLVRYSVRSDHLHLVCEACDRNALSRGVQSLSIRIAKRLNRLWKRAGKLFADRYDDRVRSQSNSSPIRRRQTARLAR